jgi:class 3 adenylate cyclase
MADTGGKVNKLAVAALVHDHFGEAAEGVVDKAPSRLLRGEGAQKSFYILKIDLANSTMLLAGKHPSTYLKLAHTFLSTVDKIALDYGADPAQTEYAGDSVIAYFPENTDPSSVILAAAWSRYCVSELSSLPGVLGSMSLKCRIVVEFAKLTVARIGPRAGTILTAIGMPIHAVAKTEKNIAPGQGRALLGFYGQLPSALRKYFSPAYEVNPPTAPPVPAAPPAPTSLGILASILYEKERKGVAGGLNSLFYNDAHQTSNPLSSLLNPPAASFAPAAAEIPSRVIGYDFRWPIINGDIGI